MSIKHVIVIDGTWAEAKAIYRANPFLHSLRCTVVDVQAVNRTRRCAKASLIASSQKSEYVVRTQPDDASVSTLEAVALALQQLHGWDDGVYDQLLQPLRQLCQLQLEHGTARCVYVVTF